MRIGEEEKEEEEEGRGVGTYLLFVMSLALFGVTVLLCIIHSGVLMVTMSTRCTSR